MIFKKNRLDLVAGRGLTHSPQRAVINGQGRNSFIYIITRLRKFESVLIVTDILHVKSIKLKITILICIFFFYSLIRRALQTLAAANGTRLGVNFDLLTHAQTIINW